MKVTLILHDFCRGWIIEKMAEKLCEALCALGISAEIRSQASGESQINHFMIFHYVDPMLGTINTVSVTHVDDALKIDMIKRQIAQGVRAMICMSRMTVDQVAGHGVDRARLTYAVPAHDGDIVPRRIVIGVTSNCYSDGRKREWMLQKLARDIRLDAFLFQFFGSGWGETAAILQQAGAAVELAEPSGDYIGDYGAIRAAVPNFDYYLYPGLDEGSLGTLDALAAGVKTIVTLQGFHLDLPHGVTHGFWDYPELRTIFEAIAADRQARLDTAGKLTWEGYARRHLEIWSSLIARDALPDDDRPVAGHGGSPPASYKIEGYKAVLANPYRRDMALRFWTPGMFDFYRQARRRLGQLRRRLLGAG